MTAREKLLAVVAMDPKRPSVGAAAPVALLALEAAAEACEQWFLDHGGKTHEPIACADAIRALAKEITE